MCWIRLSAWGLVWLLLAATGWAQPLRPWSENPFYWEYHGQPVLLVGGSDDDNLFQWPDEKLRRHLDRMQKLGANYVRNTMSDRRDGGWEVYPFRRLENGKYDLEQFNPEYWRRFERFLKWTHQRGIFVQIELWDRFDYSRQHWRGHPYNPANNVNYTHEESGLAPRYPKHPGSNEQPFFFTTPAQRNNQVVFRYQKRQIDRLLSISLQFDHVLYCIDNETSGDEQWGRFWAGYLHRRAKEAGKRICVTEMWDDWNLRGPQHRRTLDHPELYQFVDVSQNNHQKNQRHWDNFQWVRRYLKGRPRPINSVKIYGADRNKFGHSNQDGIERFWRHLLGGAAAVRFHRPPAGLGLSEPAAGCVRAARALQQLVPLWHLEPDLRLLRQREADEAYLTCRPGKAYVVYFTDGGEVELDLRDCRRELRLRWISVKTGEVKQGKNVPGGRWLPLRAPAAGGHLAVLTVR